jgi:hypothetical protein
MKNTTVMDEAQDRHRLQDVEQRHQQKLTRTRMGGWRSTR